MTNADPLLPEIVGLGAGGHCRVLLEILRRTGGWRVAGLLDPDESLHGTKVDGIEVLGNDEMAEGLRKGGVHAAFIGIGSIGNVDRRRKAFTLATKTGFGLPVLTHPFSSVADGVTIGSGVCIMPGVIVNPGVTIGDAAILNSGAIIEHDCRIGNFAHVSPGAVLGGSVVVGEGAHIGIGASIRQGLRIGKNAIVGAGAVVVEDVPDDTTVTGVPASPRRLGAVQPTRSP